jgi:hypothetical protein
VLGNIQDCRMTRETAARLDAAPDVQDWLKKRQHRKTREFQKLWQDCFGPAEARRLLAALRPAPRKPAGRTVAARTAAAHSA